MNDEICEVQGCDKEATFVGLCMLHRKKAVSGELEYDDDNTIWDTCSKGHRWTEANTHWESNSKGGKRRRCKLCLALKSARKRAEEPVVVPPSPVQPRNQDMTHALESFDKAQVVVRGKCYLKWTQWTDYTKATMPTEIEAALMCAGCPLMAACANAAEAQLPGWGVWAGERWAYGERYNDDRNRLDDDD